jgi:hypothetical protein
MRRLPPPSSSSRSLPSPAVAAACEHVLDERHILVDDVSTHLHRLVADGFQVANLVPLGLKALADTKADSGLPGELLD